MRMAIQRKEDTAEAKKLLDFLSAKYTMQILAVLQLSFMEASTKAVCQVLAEGWIVAAGDWGQESSGKEIGELGKLGFQQQRVRYWG